MVVAVEEEEEEGDEVLLLLLLLLPPPPPLPRQTLLSPPFGQVLFGLPCFDWRTCRLTGCDHSATWEERLEQSASTRSRPRPLEEVGGEVYLGERSDEIRVWKISPLRATAWTDLHSCRSVIMFPGEGREATRQLSGP